MKHLCAFAALDAATAGNGVTTTANAMPRDGSFYL